MLIIDESAPSARATRPSEISPTLRYSQEILAIRLPGLKPDSSIRL